MRTSSIEVLIVFIEIPCLHTGCATGAASAQLFKYVQDQDTSVAIDWNNFEVVLQCSGQEERRPCKKGPGGYIVGQFSTGTIVTEHPNLLLDVKKDKAAVPAKVGTGSSDDDSSASPKAMMKKTMKKSKAMKKAKAKPKTTVVLKRPSAAKQAFLQHYNSQYEYRYEFSNTLSSHL